MTRYLIFETHQDVMKDLQATFFLHLPPIIANGMQWCQQAEDVRLKLRELIGLLTEHFSHSCLPAVRRGVT